jgi:hypothetical protein
MKSAPITLTEEELEMLFRLLRDKEDRYAEKYSLLPYTPKHEMDNAVLRGKIGTVLKDLRYPI